MFFMNGLSMLDMFSAIKPPQYYGPGRKNPHKGVTLKAYRRAARDERSPNAVGTRQVRRQMLRMIDKADRLSTREADRKAAGRALLDRQAEREKSGFYDGRLSVATALAHKRAGRLHRRVLSDDTAKAKGGNLVRLG